MADAVVLVVLVVAVVVVVVVVVVSVVFAVVAIIGVVVAMTVVLQQTSGFQKSNTLYGSKFQCLLHNDNKYRCMPTSNSNRTQSATETGVM